MWVGIVVAIFFSVINIVYLISKDNVQKGENDLQECIKVLKNALEVTLDRKKQKAADNMSHIFAYIESLRYLRLVQENGIEKKLTDFSTAIDDFLHEPKKGEEELVGKYKEAVQAVYEMRFLVWKYIKFIFSNYFSRTKCSPTPLS